MSRSLPAPNPMSPDYVILQAMKEAIELLQGTLRKDAVGQMAVTVEALQAQLSPYPIVYRWDGAKYVPAPAARIFIGPNDPAGIPAMGLTKASVDYWVNTTP